MSNANQAMQVPLTELLRGVPTDARLQIDLDFGGCIGGTRNIPVGVHCHDAAELIERLQNCLSKWQDGFYKKSRHIVSYEGNLSEEQYNRLKEQCKENFGEGNFLLLEDGIKYAGMTERLD